jgi:hypothetical protein
VRDEETCLNVVAEPDEQPQSNVGDESASGEGVGRVGVSGDDDECLDDEEEQSGKHYDVGDGVL